MIDLLIVNAGRLIGPLGLASWSISAIAAPNESDSVILAFPASAGEAAQAEATVAFVSNGYVRGPCKVVRSSGDQVADGQACRTTSFYKSDTPLYALTSVWIAPEFEGSFTTPILRNPRQVIDPYAYPSQDLRAGNQGTTSVKLTLDVEGKVTDCTIAQSSGYASLDQVTCKRFRRGKYEPALLNGQPTPAIVYTSAFWGAGSGPPEQ